MYDEGGAGLPPEIVLERGLSRMLPCPNILPKKELVLLLTVAFMDFMPSLLKVRWRGLAISHSGVLAALWSSREPFGV